MALHPQLSATPLLYLENRQGLTKVGAVLPHRTGRGGDDV